MNGDTLENLFYGGAGLVLVFLIWRGWKEGVVRMFMSIVAVAGAYAVGLYGGKAVGPLFKSLGYPDQINRVLGGVCFGLLLFVLVTVLSRVLFKRTDQQESTKVKFVYGSLGALFGITLGLFTVYLAAEAVLLLGSIAEVQVAVIKERKASGLMKKTDPDASAMIQGLAELKKAFKEGESGKLIEQYDPVPKQVGVTLGKVSQMIGKQEALDRFLAYPSVEKLANHSKILALRSDGEIAQLINKQDFSGLFRHPKVRDLANDAQFAAMVKEMEFQKALEHAVPTPPKEKPAEPTPALEKAQ